MRCALLVAQRIHLAFARQAVKVFLIWHDPHTYLHCQLPHILILAIGWEHHRPSVAQVWESLSLLSALNYGDGFLGEAIFMAMILLWFPILHGR